MDKIVISGGTGFIGSVLIEKMLESGNEIVVLTRKNIENQPNSLLRYVKWDGRTAQGPWINELEDASIIINLAGENIGEGRWSFAKKQRILNSRLDAGKAFCDALSKITHKPDLFIQASAIGIYGISDTREMDEKTQPGGDYLAQVGKLWEESTLPVEGLGIRRAVIRTGVVLDNTKGVLPKLILPYRLFAGGRLGSGDQWLSWIHIKDEVNALLFIMDHRLDGLINLTAPNPIRNHDAGHVISKVINRPNWFPVPGFILKLVLGEMSTLVLDGQKVLPSRLASAGYKFLFPDFESAVRQLVGKQ